MPCATRRSRSSARSPSCRPSRSRTRRRPRPVRRRAGSAPSRSPATATSPRWTRSPRPRRSSRPGSRSTTGAGPGVPFYLRMGKRLPKRATEIAIQFKEVPHQLFKDSATDPEANLLAMRIQPDEGIMLRFGGQGAGPGHRRPQRDHGLHLRLGVPGRQPGRVRDADPRRAARRRVAVHARRRGRGGVGHRRPDHHRVGRDGRRPTSRTTRPARGARRRPRTCSPAKAGAGAGSEHDQGRADAEGSLGRDHPARPRRRRGDPADRRSRGERSQRRRPRVRRDHRGRDASRRRRPDRAGGSAQARRADDALALARALDRRDRDQSSPGSGPSPTCCVGIDGAGRRAGTSPRGRR